MDYKMDLAQLKAAAGSGPLIRHPAAIESVLTSFARMPLSQLYHPTMHAAKPDLVQDLLGFAVPDCQRDLRDLRTGDVLTCLDSHFADPAVPGYETRFADAFFHLTMLPYHFTQPIRSLPRSKGNGASKPSDETASLPQAPTIETIRDKMRHIGSRCLSPLQIQSGLLQIALTDYFSYLCQIDPSGGFDVWREAVEPLLALRPRCATLRVSQDPAFISLGQALLLALELFIHPDDYTIDDTEFQASWLTDMLLVEPLHGLTRAGLFDREVLVPTAEELFPDDLDDMPLDPPDDDLTELEDFEDDDVDFFDDMLTDEELDALFGGPTPPRTAK